MSVFIVFKRVIVFRVTCISTSFATFTIIVILFETIVILFETIVILFAIVVILSEKPCILQILEAHSIV